MKKRINELNVDFIGRGRPLTKEEDEAISKFLKASQEKKRMIIKNKTSIRTKINA